MAPAGPLEARQKALQNAWMDVEVASTQLQAERHVEIERWFRFRNNSADAVRRFCVLANLAPFEAEFVAAGRRMSGYAAEDQRFTQRYRFYQVSVVRVCGKIAVRCVWEFTTAVWTITGLPCVLHFVAMHDSASRGAVWMRCVRKRFGPGSISARRVDCANSKSPFPPPRSA